MPLETGTTLDDLNPLWPEQNDGLSVQDDHTRLIKSILQSAFGANPNPREFSEAFTFGNNVFIAGFADIGGFITTNPQVPIVGGQINGATGLVIGADFGIGLSERTAAGTYEIKISETGWNFDDLLFSANVDYGLGGLGAATMVEATTNTDGTWVKIVTVPLNDPTTAADPVRFGFTITDAGRALP